MKILSVYITKILLLMMPLFCSTILMRASEEKISDSVYVRIQHSKHGTKKDSTQKNKTNKQNSSLKPQSSSSSLLSRVSSHPQLNTAAATYYQSDNNFRRRCNSQASLTESINSPLPVQQEKKITVCCPRCTQCCPILCSCLKYACCATGFALGGYYIGVSVDSGAKDIESLRAECLQIKSFVDKADALCTWAILQCGSKSSDLVSLLMKKND